MSPSEYFFANLEQLFKDHPNQWVAVNDHAVVAVAPSFSAMMATEAVRKTRVELVYRHLDSKTIPAELAARQAQQAKPGKTKPQSAQKDTKTDAAAS